MARTRSVGWALLPIVVTAAILAILPSIWFGDSPYTTSLAVQALVFASYGVGFNLIFGSTNQLFLCVGALAGVGGYGAVILIDETSLPMAAGVVVGTASAALVGGLLSWIAVRRSLGIIFTGIVTLVFSLGFANLLLGQRDLTGSETGLVVTAAADDLADDQRRRLLPLRRPARRLPDRLPRAPALARRVGVPRLARRRGRRRARGRRRRAIPDLRRDDRLGDDRPDGRAPRVQRGLHQPGDVQLRPRGRARPRARGVRRPRHPARPGDRRGRVRDPRRAAVDEPRAPRGPLRRLRDRDLPRLQTGRRRTPSSALYDRLVARRRRKPAVVQPSRDD